MRQEAAKLLTMDEFQVISKALSDPLRLEMLRMLAAGRAECCGVRNINGAPEGGICVCEFTDQLGIIQSRASYHLRILQEAGLVEEQVVGRWSFYSLNPDQLRRYTRAIGEFLLAD